MEKSFKIYIAALLFIFSLGLISMAAFTLIVDPAGVYGYVDIEGFNHEKTELMEGGGRFDKGVALLSGGFDTVILGTSRAEIGIDPRSPLFGGRKVYNASLPGSTFYELERAFELAVTKGNVRTVILSLDFDFNFLTEMKGSGDFYQSAFSDSGGTPRLTRLISIDELQRSFETVKENKRGRRADYTPLGHKKDMDFNRPGKRGRSFMAALRTSFIKNTFYSRAAYTSEPMALFGDVVERARGLGVELKIFISPVHAFQLEIMRVSGAYPEFERWKRELTSILADDASSSHGKDSFMLWDFSGYNAINSENFGSTEDPNTEMRWYWEPTHYRGELGEVILARLFGDEEEGRIGAAPLPFGVSINSTNIEAHLTALREERDGVYRTYPDYQSGDRRALHGDRRGEARVSPSRLEICRRD